MQGPDGYADRTPCSYCGDKDCMGNCVPSDLDLEDELFDDGSEEDWE